MLQRLIVLIFFSTSNSTVYIPLIKHNPEGYKCETRSRVTFFFHYINEGRQQSQKQTGKQTSLCAAHKKCSGCKSHRSKDLPVVVVAE